MKQLFTSILLMGLLGLSLPSFAESEKDPLESINRITFEFNDFLDRYFLKPVAKGYRKVTPDFMEEGIGNFFDNLAEPLNIVSGLAQGKVSDAGSDSLRLLVNSTVGLFGFIDIGSRIGLEKHNEDFGQALGKWGVPSGPYLVLPIFGPSTVRDAFTRIPDSYLSPKREIDHTRTRIEVYALDVIDTRAGLLETEKLLAGDKYSFIRDAFLQNREFRVTDGGINDDEEFFEDDFDVDDESLFEDEEE
ncbi:MAG: VacJ family lipoprotein [Pseudomonadales bacterium]|nr:VacJ family lipoprotein [Pseudomonadales bacterium]